MCTGSRCTARALVKVAPMHTKCKSCLYCKFVQFVSIGDPPPIKSWKRPVLLVAGVLLTTCTVLALRFAWERVDAAFFGAMSMLVMIIALLGVAIAFRGCDACVARFLGKTI
jgi:hypothetical protein